MSNNARPLFHRGRLKATRSLSANTFDPATCPLYGCVDESLTHRLEDLSLPSTFARRILIYGARTDALYALCTRLFPKAMIVTADWCAAALDQSTPQRAVFWEEDAPFEKGSFDIILSCLTLQVCERPPIALANLFQLLREGGFFLTQFMGGASLAQLRDALIQADFEASRGARARTIPMMDMQTTLTLFTRSGFTGCICDEERVMLSFKTAKSLQHFLRARGAQIPLSASPPPNRAFYGAAIKHLADLTLHLDIVTCLGWRANATYPSLPDAPAS
ncbi:MAG: class I SAM-dependent methyltransferase [Proteobacteria bacterium]|nr:class I SAM-dependent methyltransferase [Pseudomonadota bacterium]